MKKNKKKKNTWESFSPEKTKKEGERCDFNGKYFSGLHDTVKNERVKVNIVINEKKNFLITSLIGLFKPEGKIQEKKLQNDFFLWLVLTLNFNSW